MKYALVLLLLIVIANCTPLDQTKRVKYEVVKIDTNRGFGYPTDFNRARDLRKAEMFSSAAYIYIILYPDWRDSVIVESVRMSHEIKAIDSNETVAQYFQQAIGTEMLQDPAVKPIGGSINKQEMAKRYKWSSDLMNELAAYGVR